MSDETTNVTDIVEEELIDVPSYMSEDYNISTADVCWTTDEGCYDAMYDECSLLCQSQGICGAYQTCCQVSCESPCQDACELNCQDACEYCQVSCEWSCQDCQITCELSSQRPSDFTWTSTVSKGVVVANINGSPAYLTATEWNAFTTQINLFRTYKGLSAITFTTAVTGEPMQAAQFNEARMAINDMSPASPVPDAVEKNSPILAFDINALSAALNSIM